MAFHERPWGQREVALGDEAETVFEAVQTRGFARHGLLRPPIQVHKLPLVVRYTPDYLRGDAAVEVMGCGRDQVLKLKLEKLNALIMWNHMIMVTHLFVWDSHKRRYGECPVADIDLGDVNVSRFHEGKAYYELPLADLPIVWTDHA